MMSGAAEVTNYHMIKMFSAQNHQANYVRIQPSSLGTANPQMDDASDQNIQALMQVGTETAQNCAEIDDIITVLLQGEDPVVFE